jgi:hypothetical protein
MPFKSEAQRRYLWANEPEIARDWTDTYGSKIKKAYGGITRLGYRYGGDTMGGPNDRSSKSGASAPAGGASAGGNYGGNRNPDQSYGGGDVGSLGITGAQPANVFTDVTKDFLNPQKDYFTQTYSGQPNFLGFGGGYRTLKTPNDARSGYQSRFNPMGLMSLLGGFISTPFTLAKTGIDALRNKLGPAWKDWTDSEYFNEFLKKRKAAQYEDAIARDNLYDPNARIQETSFKQDYDYNVPYYLDEFQPEGLDLENLYEDFPTEEIGITGINYPNETETILDEAKRINAAMEDPDSVLEKAKEINRRIKQEQEATEGAYYP